jgi:hypothetical protein
MFRLVQAVEKEIHAALKDKDLAWRNLDCLIAQYLFYYSKKSKTI